MIHPSEYFISVDVETCGPSPSIYSLLSIGVCTIVVPQSTFYIELQLVNGRILSEAMEISGLGWDHLKDNGFPPSDAMARFSQCLETVTPNGEQPIFLAFNAPFDWMFINEYFYRYLGRNPFGHKALDIKAYYMRSHGVPWSETGMKQVSAQYLDHEH